MQTLNIDIHEKMSGLKLMVSFGTYLLKNDICPLLQQELQDFGIYGDEECRNHFDIMCKRDKKTQEMIPLSINDILEEYENFLSKYIEKGVGADGDPWWGIEITEVIDMRDQLKAHRTSMNL